MNEEIVSACNECEYQMRLRTEEPCNSCMFNPFAQIPANMQTNNFSKIEINEGEKE